MRTLSADDLLVLREQGAALHAIDRALQIVACALPDRDPVELARLPLGCRDALLLSIRRSTLGDRLDAQDVCAGCGERVEVELTCSALASAAATPPPEWALDRDGYRLTLRALDSFDAAAAAQRESVGAARAELLARCIVRCDRADATVRIDSLPDDIVSAIAASIAEHDSGAELMLEFVCPQCRHGWQRVLDVATFVWTELAARAQRLALEVHTLARAYGWREADILAMTDARRATYLALVTA